MACQHLFDCHRYKWPCPPNHGRNICVHVVAAYVSDAWLWLTVCTLFYKRPLLPVPVQERLGKVPGAVPHLSTCLYGLNLNYTAEASRDSIGTIYR
jgi:hypothetical protein